MGYFAFMAFQSATVYYYTVGEMDDVGATPDGRFVRVSGKLVPSCEYWLKTNGSGRT